MASHGRCLRTETLQTIFEDKGFRKHMYKFIQPGSNNLLRNLGYSTLSELTVSSHRPYSMMGLPWLRDLLGLVEAVEKHCTQMAVIGACSQEDLGKSKTCVQLVKDLMREAVAASAAAGGRGVPSVSVGRGGARAGAGAGSHFRGPSSPHLHLHRHLHASPTGGVSAAAAAAASPIHHHQPSHHNRGWHDAPHQPHRDPRRPTRGGQDSGPARVSAAVEWHRPTAEHPLPPLPEVRFRPLLVVVVPGGGASAASAASVGAHGGAPGFGGGLSPSPASPAASVSPQQPSSKSRIRLTLGSLPKDLNNPNGAPFLKRVLVWSAEGPGPGATFDGEIAQYNAEALLQQKAGGIARVPLGAIVRTDLGEGLVLQPNDSGQQMREFGMRKEEPRLVYYVVEGIDAKSMFERIVRAYPQWSACAQACPGGGVTCVLGIPLRYCIRVCARTLEHLHLVTTPLGKNSVFRSWLAGYSTESCRMRMAVVEEEEEEEEITSSSSVVEYVFQDFYMLDAEKHRTAVDTFLKPLMRDVGCESKVQVRMLGGTGWDVRPVVVKVEDIDQRPVIRFVDSDVAQPSNALFRSLSVERICEWPERRIAMVRMPKYQADALDAKVKSIYAAPVSFASFPVLLHFVCDDPVPPREIVEGLQRMHAFRWMSLDKVMVAETNGPALVNSDIVTLAVTIDSEEAFRSIQLVCNLANHFPFYLGKDFRRCVMMLDLRIVYGVGLEDLDPCLVWEELQPLLGPGERVLSIKFLKPSPSRRGRIARIVTNSRSLGGSKGQKSRSFCGRRTVAFFDYFVRAVDVEVDSAEVRKSHRFLKFAVWINDRLLRCYYPGSLCYDDPDLDPAYACFQLEFEDELRRERKLTLDPLW